MEFIRSVNGSDSRCIAGLEVRFRLEQNINPISLKGKRDKYFCFASLATLNINRNGEKFSALPEEFLPHLFF